MSTTYSMAERRAGRVRLRKRVESISPEEYCRRHRLGNGPPHHAAEPSGVPNENELQSLMINGRRMEEVTTRAAADNDSDADADADAYDNMKCEVCSRPDDEDQMLLCDKCDGGYHMFCVCPILVTIPPGNWFCPSCAEAEIPKLQLKIDDFFRIQKFSAAISIPKMKKRRKQGVFTLSKRSRKLVLHTASKDPERRLRQMTSLATALTSVGVEFSDDLTYLPSLAPRISNCSALEKGGMQIMGKDDKATFDSSKSLCQMGLWPPLMVTQDAREGFVVEADSPIKDMTIIAEYTGDVDFMCNRTTDAGDSMMGLLFTEDPSKELVICPDKRGNLARFVSGINNHSSDGRKKQNVRCVRFDVEGEARALLIAIRDIPAGERLYYDYNGYHKDYPTEHFV